MILQGLWLPVLMESFMGIIRQIQPWSAMFSGEAFLSPSLIKGRCFTFQLTNF